MHVLLEHSPTRLSGIISVVSTARLLQERPSLGCFGPPALQPRGGQLFPTQSLGGVLLFPEELQNIL